MSPAAPKSLLQRWKPRASGRVQLLLAGALWSVVGATLLFFGVVWTLDALGGPLGLAVLLGGVGAGLLKGRFVLDRAAGRIADRIAARGDGHCAGGFLSWRSWLLVALMSGAGRLLRGGLAPRGAIGPLYAAIGAALLFSSRVAWRRWSRAGGRRGADP